MNGFFGKIPSHGDFITRNLSRRFLDRWDFWLQNCIAESKAQLGEQWLDVYLTSPIWRFSLNSGICGGDSWAGILMPSVDRVGRYFPLTIAIPLASACHPFQVSAHGEAWFQAVEHLALRTLEDDHFEVNGLESALAVVPELNPGILNAEQFAASGNSWSLGVFGAAGADVPAALANALVRAQTRNYSLWWTNGAQGAAPSAVAVEGLPDPKTFVEYLQGVWGAPVAHWDSEAGSAMPAGEGS